MSKHKWERIPVSRLTDSSTRSRQADEGAFESFLERAIDLFTVVDGDGRFLYVNPSAQRFFGVSAEECLGRSAFSFVHPDDLDRTKSSFATWLAGRAEDSWSHENRQVNAATGEVLHVLWTVTAQYGDDGEIVRFASIAQDVTELRRMQRETATRELRHRSLLEGMLDAVITIDPLGVIQEASNSVAEVFGYEPETLIGRNVSLLIPEPHHSAHDDYLARYRATGKTWILNTTRVFECLHKSGETIVCELSVSRIDVPGEEQPSFLGSFRDVSARVRAERALADSERRFRAVFDQEFQYVGILAPDGTLLEVNQTALGIAGAERADILGLPFWDTPWWSHSEEVRERLRSAIAKASLGELVRFETSASTSTGSRRFVDFSVKPVLDEAGETALLVAEGRDLTDLKRAQERETSMLRALASIGESASVLAHEIKNPITAVNAALRAVAKELGEDEQVILRELVERMQRLEHLIRRTLSFAKPLDLHPEAVTPAESFAEIRALLAAELTAGGVELVTDASPSTPAMLTDPELLHEVLLNLVRNSIEAGARTIALRAHPAENHQVELAIDDDGSGLPADVRNRMFEPFVTTKASGTGIGLALCRKIVEQHGGTISAGTSEFGGATFVIRLPSVQG